MISVFSTHTINLFFFKLFVRLYMTVILFFLAFSIIPGSVDVINNNSNNHNTNAIIRYSTRDNVRKDNCVSNTNFSALSDVGEALRMSVQIIVDKFNYTTTEKRMNVQFSLNGYGNTGDALTCVIFKYRQTREHFLFPINLEDS